MLSEQTLHAGVGITEEQLPARAHAQERRRGARLGHALAAEPAGRVHVAEENSLDRRQLEPLGIPARDPHDAHAPAAAQHALDDAGAAQRLIVRVRRDHQERGGGVDTRQRRGVDGRHRRTGRTGRFRAARPRPAGHDARRRHHGGGGW
jgi:hypothetical protein